MLIGTYSVNVQQTNQRQLSGKVRFSTSVTVKSDEDRALITRIYKYSSPIVQLRLRICKLENIRWTLRGGAKWFILHNIECSSTWLIYFLRKQYHFRKLVCSNERFSSMHCKKKISKVVYFQFLWTSRKCPLKEN